MYILVSFKYVNDNNDHNNNGIIIIIIIKPTPLIVDSAHFKLSKQYLYFLCFIHVLEPFFMLKLPILQQTLCLEQARF